MDVAANLWDGTRVLAMEVEGGIASGCAELLRGLGATVTSMEVSGTTRSLGDVDLAGDVDVVLLDHGFGSSRLGDDTSTLEAWTDAGLIVCVLSPYGLTGPFADDVGSELTVQARAGILTTNGFAEDPPLAAGVPVATRTSSVLGLAAVAAALYDHRRTGRGELIDLGAFDAVLSLLGTLLPSYLLEGRNPDRVGNRHMMTAPWNTYETADGWVVLTVMGQSLWASFVEMLGAPELAEDERFRDALNRVANVGELDAAVTAWTRRFTTEQVLAAAQEAGVPAAPICSVREALHELEREGAQVIRRDESEVRAALPFTVHPTADPPALPFGVRRSQPSVGRGPLAGVRVLELGAFTSGPLAGRLLGMLGADVLKVEPPDGENSRILAQQIGGCGYLYHLNNTDKRGCVLDIREPDDAERLRRLAEDADVFLTNLAPATLDRFGVGYDDLAARAPRLIYCAVTGFGVTTPRARDKAFDTMIQALSGIMSLTGFPDGPPTKIAISFVDLLGACTAAAAVIATLHAREEGTGGCLVNVPMMDTAVWSTQEVWEDILLRDADPQRIGNTHPGRALHDVFPTLDGAVAIEAPEPADLVALLEALDLDPAPDDPVSLAAEVACRVASTSTETVVRTLQAAAIPAAEVLDIERIMSHPQVAERCMLQSYPIEDGFTVQVIGAPFTFHQASVGLRRPAPGLGADPPAWGAREPQT